MVCPDAVATPMLDRQPRWRGWLARLGDLSPRSARLLASSMKHQGLRKHNRTAELACELLLSALGQTIF